MRIFLALLILTSCKTLRTSTVQGTDVNEDQTGLPNKDSANALGLKLASPYHIDILCLPSLKGEGIADVEKGCSASKAYINLQCGSEVEVQIHDNPSLIELEPLSKKQAAIKADGFWIVEAHGEFDVINQLHKVDRICGYAEQIPSNEVLRVIRKHDQRGIWLSACACEIVDPEYGNVGYSSRNFQNSFTTTFRPINAFSSPGPENSVVYLTDQLCSVYAKERDGDESGTLSGIELGSKLPDTITRIMSVSQYKVFSKDIPSMYELLESREGFFIVNMTCQDRLGAKHTLAYRGEREDSFFDNDGAARAAFASQKPVENESIVRSVLTPTRLSIADRNDEDPFIDRIRLADGFPQTFRVGRRKADLETLSDCRPNVEQGFVFKVRRNLKASIPVLGGGGQDAVPADFQLPLPKWR